jgi:hypothetical protein
MKSISNSDFSLLIEKLPILLQCARDNIGTDDLKAINAHRLLTLLLRKLSKQQPLNKKQNDKKRNRSCSM